MKSLKTLLQEVTAGIKAWANANFSLGTHVHGNITNDGKVGTTANKPLITGTGGAVQAGSFGNAANTFCEGNDSRLSDARTPVAHTHLTADVTDLLNTAHEWTKEQICDEGFTSKSTTMERCVTPATTQHINFTFKDKNGKGIGAIRRYFKNNGEQQIQIFGNTKIKDGQYDETGSDVFFGFFEVLKPDGTMYFSFDGYLNNSIRPRLTNTYQLGDSSYQWKSVYAQSYYYNGTPWGLDTFNQWTGNNKFVSPNTNFGFKSTTAEAGSLTASSNWIYWQDKNDFQDAYISRDIWSDGSDCLRIAITSKRSNGAPSTTGTKVGCGFRLNIHANGNTSIDPFDNGGTDLGTSTNKWKTLNGVNPGALSLPDYSNVVNLDTTNWSKSGDMIVYTPTFDGWLQITIPNDDDGNGVKSNMISILDSGTSPLAGFSVSNILGPRLYFLYPVRASRTYWLYIKSYSDTITVARLVKCLGNV